MQASQKNVIWSVAIVGVILLIVMLFGFSNIKVPTASEIASDIVIEIPEFPEFPEYENLDNEKLNDVWNVLFGKCIVNLEDKDNLRHVLDELDLEDIREFVEDEIENFDKFGSVYFDEEDFVEDNFDEIEVEISKLGQCEYQDVIYNEEEDSEVIVTFEYDFKYELEDSDKVYKDTLYVTGIIEYDEDGISEDVEVNYLI